MKLKFVLISLVSLLVLSCADKKKDKNATHEIKTAQKNEVEQTESYILLKNNCYACHSVTAKSHDEIIAPPMVAIKRRFMKSYPTKSAFIEAMTNWVLDPTEETALMRGAVKQFNVMPKQPFNEGDIHKIAGYIYENELEKPTWFEEHFNEEHPNGMGNGQGRGKGMRNN